MYRLARITRSCHHRGASEVTRARLARFYTLNGAIYVLTALVASTRTFLTETR